MDYPFSTCEKDMAYWAPKRDGVVSSAAPDGAPRNLVTEDPFSSRTELMNYDSFSGSCVSQGEINPTFSFHGWSSPLMPMISGTPGPMNFSEQNMVPLRDKMAFPQLDPVLANLLDFADGDDSGPKQNNASFQNYNDTENCLARRPLGDFLAEKMLRALSLFHECSGGGFLAQVWVPIKLGDKYILSTSDQPYLLDQILTGYREISRAYIFSAEGLPGSFLGLPGRVFMSRVPEWTSNVVYYRKAEYLRASHAVDHKVHGSIGLPIFNPSENSCCAVLELVTVKEKVDFDTEMETVCHALQAVNLRTITYPRIQYQYLSNSRRAALAEVIDVLRVVCHAHRLPLALAWIPCTHIERSNDNDTLIKVLESASSPNERRILCVEDSACYINDKQMQGFIHACMGHYLEEGQGIAGKAIQSNHPFFSPDVKVYDITDYPLVHHARKFGLNAAVAVRLRSTYTGDYDYILEFFLPVNLTGKTEQQLLLDNLSVTMQRICKSLRTVSDSELVREDASRMGFQREEAPDFPPVSGNRIGSQSALSDSDLCPVERTPSDAYNLRSKRVETDGPHGQAMTGSRGLAEKKRSTAEKNVSLNVLQQYFSGSLKDAAKSIGVCPTTLKRICRRHGILRWPSRKINKVNRSLRKIQTVLDSVQEMEGGLNFDGAARGLANAGPVVRDLDAGRMRNLLSATSDMPVPSEGKARTSKTPSVDEKSELSGFGILSQSSSSATSSGMADSSNASGSLVYGSSSSCQSLDERKCKATCGDSGSRITVKVAYREDVIRFKFEQSAGCLDLYEEVARRFKLQLGTFQLKYLDDEDEWVMLVTESDLQECLELLEFSGTQNVKLVARDILPTNGSAESSNCFLR